MDNVLDELTRQIDSDIQQLATLEAGSEEEAAVSNRLARNYKLRIEHIQMLKETDLERKRMEFEKTTQKHREWFDWAGLGVKVAGGIGSAGLLTFWALKSFKFEETGTICSKSGRDICSRLMKFLKI